MIEKLRKNMSDGLCQQTSSVDQGQKEGDKWAKQAAKAPAG